MNGWQRRVDRGLGYLGLFLIGSVSWLVDHLDWRGAEAPPASTRPRLEKVARDAGGSVGIRAGAPAERRAA